MSRPTDVGVARNQPVTTRMTPGEKAKTEAQAALRGFGSTSDYIRKLVNEDAARIDTKRSKA